MSRVGLYLFIIAGALSLLYFLQPEQSVVAVNSSAVALKNLTPAGEWNLLDSHADLEHPVTGMDRESMVEPLPETDIAGVSAEVITIHTLLEDGTPLGGVSVYVYDDETRIFDPRALELPSQDPDPVLLGKTIGELFVTDAQGVAQLPLKYLDAELVAISGDLIAWEWVDGEHEVKVRMMENRTLSICAVHQDGTPAVGIDLGVFQVWSGTEDLVWPHATARTPADGCVSIENLGDWFGVWDSEAAAGVVGLFRDPIATMFNPQRIPEEAIVLTLPGYGSVEVQLEAGISFFPNKEYQVEVVLDPHPQIGRNLQQLKAAFDDSESLELYGFLREGSAFFPCIGLDLDFIIHIDHFDALDSTYLSVRGPSNPGEHVVVKIAPMLDEKHILLRLEGSDGKPLANTDFQFHLRTVEGGHWNPRAMPLRSDAQGDVDFQAYGSLFLGNEGLRSLQIEAAIFLDPLSSSLSGSLLVQPQVLETSDRIGVLRMTAARLLVSGQVIGLAAKEFLQLDLEVEQCLDADFAKYPSWKEYQRAFCDEKGQFLCRFATEPSNGLLRIAPSRFESYHRYYSFAAGDENLVLDFDTSFQLDGRVLLAPDFDASLLNVEFRSDTNEKNRGVRTTSKLEADGSFQLTGLHHVLGKVKITGPFRSSTMASIEEVMPHLAGEAGDPRLHAIDLNGKLNQMEIFVVDDSGARLTHVSVHVDNRTRGWQRLQPEDRILFVTPKTTLHAVIGSPGFAFQEVELLPGSNHVVLDPGFDVEFVLEGMEQLPRELTYQVSLTSIRGYGSRFDAETVVVPSNSKFLLIMPSVGTYSWSVRGSRDGKHTFGFTTLEEADFVQVTPGKVTHLLLPLEKILKRLED